MMHFYRSAKQIICHIRAISEVHRWVSLTITPQGALIQLQEIPTIIEALAGRFSTAK